MSSKLYAVYLGGKAVGANTEVHDTVFLVSDNLLEDKAKIKNLWFGDKKSVHIDAFAEIDGVGEYKILISKSDASVENLENDFKLFFINFGAGDPGKLSEKHQSGFFVGQNKMDAIKQAKHVFLVGENDTHLDNSLEIDDCIDLGDNFDFKIYLVKGVNEGVKIVNQYAKL